MTSAASGKPYRPLKQRNRPARPRLTPRDRPFCTLGLQGSMAVLPLLPGKGGQARRGGQRTQPRHGLPPRTCSATKPSKAFIPAASLASSAARRAGRTTARTFHRLSRASKQPGRHSSMAQRDLQRFVAGGRIQAGVAVEHRLPRRGSEQGSGEGNQRDPNGEQEAQRRVEPCVAPSEHPPADPLEEADMAELPQWPGLQRPEPAGRLRPAAGRWGRVTAEGQPCSRRLPPSRPGPRRPGRWSQHWPPVPGRDRARLPSCPAGCPVKVDRADQREGQANPRGSDCRSGSSQRERHCMLERLGQNHQRPPSPARRFAQEVQHHLAPVRRTPVLEQVDALPGAEDRPALGDRDGQLSAG